MFLILAGVFMVAGFVAMGMQRSQLDRARQTNRNSSIEPQAEPLYGIARTTCFVIAFLFFAWALVSTSLIKVPTGKYAVVVKNWGTKTLSSGDFVALHGEMGPQADILRPGYQFEWLITIINDIEYYDVVLVPPGKCGVVSAKQGIPMKVGEAFAPPWDDASRLNMINDARYFLTDGKGVRAPQSTVLTPGPYTPHPYLWEKVTLVDATTIEQGTVGVVKSRVEGPVIWGKSFTRDVSTDGKLRVMNEKMLPKGSADVRLVPVGSVGVWEEPLPNGQYYINPEAYKVTKVPFIAVVYEYKGGYKRQFAQLQRDVKGEFTTTITEADIPVDLKAADAAIPTKIEGWDVPQELRALVQIQPDLAPFVVASLGLTAENSTEVVETRVITPTIRSVLRTVAGGMPMPFETEVMELGKDKVPLVDDQGKLKTKKLQEVRPARLNDLISNRGAIENAIELRAREEAAKEGINILEVRLSESALPGQFLATMQREQLAVQEAKTLIQVELTQVQRQKTENAKATAERQQEIVQGTIAAQVAEQKKIARETEAQGELAYMKAIAEGTMAQKDALGADAALQLQMFQSGLKEFSIILKEQPQLVAAALQNAGKFVPHIVVNNSGGGSSKESATEGLVTALLGQFLERNTPQKFGDMVPIPKPNQPLGSNE